MTILTKILKIDDGSGAPSKDKKSTREKQTDVIPK